MYKMNDFVESTEDLRPRWSRKLPEMEKAYGLFKVVVEDLKKKNKCMNDLKIEKVSQQGEEEPSTLSMWEWHPFWITTSGECKMMIQNYNLCYYLNRGTTFS